MIPFSRHNISRNDVSSVIKVLKSNYLTKGYQVPKFEKKLSQVTKSKYVIACNSATSALHLACMALGLKKNDIVWTSTNTFAASSNCALNCGCKIDFIDIDKNTWNICVVELEKKLKIAAKKKKLPKALIPVHFGGQPTEQIKIKKLSKKYNFKIIEDASHSIGAEVNKEPVGSCKWSDLTIFSFHPVKIITTGEGGAVSTNNAMYAKTIRELRENGITNVNKSFKYKAYYPNYYEQVSAGYNYRMSDISAALGLSQLKRLKKFIYERNKIAKIYKNYFKNTSIKFQKILPNIKSSYHLFVIQFNKKKLKIRYKEIFSKFKKKGFVVNLHYKALHLNPLYRNMGFKLGQFPISENYSKSAISIPIFIGLKHKDIKKIITVLKEIVEFKK